MRYPEGHNDTVRTRIVETASRILRREGLDAVSIPKLMKAAGLTHGGFYIHFKDRDDLVVAAVAHAANDSAFAAEDVTAAEAFAKYLSQDHLDQPDHGCVVAALGDEGARRPGRIGRAFAEAARGLLRRVEKTLHPRSERHTISDDTLRKASQIVGAVVLARLVQDDALAGRLLVTAREQVAR
ncbi:MAG TPA: helix-turn-helix domain-containing protein [Polyangia bacterium]|nr:helix-turn-helix domain-containing protein [Polyangia bacterium]